MVDDPAVEERRRRAAELQEEISRKYPEPGTFRAALLDQIAAFRRWAILKDGEPIALWKAFAFMDDAAIEHAYMAELLELFGPTELRPVSIFKSFPPRWPETGKYAFPSMESVATRLRPVVLGALRDGRLVATGLDPGNPVTAKPITITAKLWELLVPDWERSAVTCEGKVVAIGITVKAAECQPESPRGRSSGRVSPAELERWFDQIGSKAAGGQRGAVSAARAEFGELVTRDRVIDLYRKKKPSRPGRPSKNART